METELVKVARALFDHEWSQSSEEVRDEVWRDDAFSGYFLEAAKAAIAAIDESRSVSGWRDIALVRQKHRWGCAAATLAMLLGKSYDEAADLLTNGKPEALESSGFGYHVPESQLVQHGYAVSRKWRVFQPGNQKRDPWPCEPFADMHWCEVIAGPRGAHAVVMLADGTVLDPVSDEPKRLTDYPEVNFIAGIVPLPAPPGDIECPRCHGEGMFVPTAEFKAQREQMAKWWREYQDKLAAERTQETQNGE